MTNREKAFQELGKYLYKAYRTHTGGQGTNVIKLVIQGRTSGSARIFKKRFGMNFQRLGIKSRRRGLRQKKIWREGQRAET